MAMLSGAVEQNVKVLNSPARVYSVSNPAALTISKLTIDNCMCKFIGEHFRTAKQHPCSSSLLPTRSACIS